MSDVAAAHSPGGTISLSLTSGDGATVVELTIAEAARVARQILVHVVQAEDEIPGLDMHTGPCVLVKGPPPADVIDLPPAGARWLAMGLLTLAEDAERGQL